MTVISLTALPSRFSTLESVLLSLGNQSATDYEIHLNLPHYCELEAAKVEAPDFLERIPRLKVFRTADHGPHTKLLPTLMRLPGDATVITVDDDIVYHPDMVREHRRNALLFPGCAIGFAGRLLADQADEAAEPVTDGSRGHFYGPVRRPARVKILEGYKSASYTVSFLKDSYGKYTQRFWEDDVVISSVLASRGVDRVVVSHPDETDFSARAESFPVVQILQHPSTGCSLWREAETGKDGDDAPTYFAGKGWL